MIFSYIKAGGLLSFMCLVVCHAAFIVAQVLTNIWLSAWTNDASSNSSSTLSDRDLRLGVYGGLGLVQSKYRNTYF